MNKQLLSLFLICAGLILFIDEIWMFIPWIGHSGWLIGDWSFLHVEPFHHWMLGLVMIVAGCVIK